MQSPTETLHPFNTEQSTEANPEDDIDLIDTETACTIVGGHNKPVHRSTLWRLVKAGKLPPPNRKLRRWNRRPFVAAVRAMLAEDGD